MQLKGLIKIITIVLVLTCLYQLSFTYFVNGFESKQKARAIRETKADVTGKTAAEAKAIVDNRYRYLLDSLSSEKVAYGESYTKAKDKELKLGLDLQGGLSVVMEVGTAELVSSLANNPKDPGLVKALEEAVRLKANGTADFITLFNKAYTSQNANANLAKIFVKPGSTEIKLASTNEEVLEYLRKESKGAIKNTYGIIGKRIDQFGVSSSTISLDENKGIINVELPGSQNPEKIVRLLEASAKLEFWETYSNTNSAIGLGFDKADKALAAYLNGTSTKDSTGNSTDSTSGAKKTLDQLAGAGAKDTSADGKVAQFKKEHPLILFQGKQVGPADPETGKPREDCELGYIDSKDTTEFSKYMNMDIVKNNFPKDLKILYGRPPMELRLQAPKLLTINLIKTVQGSDKPRLAGDQVEKAIADFDPMTNEPIISMRMKSQGANIWANMTGANVGKPIAIALDNIVYSAPAPRSKIEGGSSQISGSFTVEETQDISSILASGKIDAPARIVQKDIVGPTLGAENIAAGKKTFLIAFLVIFILMVVYYNTAGIVADIALILNLLFTIGILASVGFSLTMAGIAGLILTIGMAVDTNVIIFERIKEELSQGKTHADAVNEGYRRSLAPVLDGHITVFLTALILFIFGLGPILGFATTQMLGIALSLFCGILISRMLTDVYMSRGKHLEYFTGLSRKVFKKFNFKFIEWRKYAYGISVIVLLLGVGSFFNGFDYGIEFKGGRSYDINIPNTMKPTDIAKGLTSVFGKEPVVKTVGAAGDKVNITTDYLVTQSGKDVENKVVEKLYEGLSKLGVAKQGMTIEDFKNSIPQSKTVLPTISEDLKKGAIYATLWSMVIIFIYIFLRFRKWQYSLGTIIALLHDVLVTLAVFSFCRKFVPFPLEIDQHFIAAVLTVIGFSMNDTVIVFDRIREYFRKTPNGDKKQIINSAINDTLSRTIMTSLTVFLTILILFLFGGEVTKGFAFAMLIGVITGTYSSIFVAAPVLVDLDKGQSLNQEVDRDAKIKELKELA